ncbi:helix-turn-helix transcriptional regulator [Variovorax sp. RTB1]|uniref:helix-turn-helix transcriptional regulator n=1 Tax=Variovorax sp. RTB1 TaxID=3048631 RepID=UPI002B2258BC|nr:helix-turn-helix transcriptional regulator [Variovorax sp. RTB1]MEB0114473.1 helix-turn-helix transcriptional regulator [Variovorax sp. RTB1]
MTNKPLLARAVTAVAHLADAEPPWAEILESGRRLIGADSATFMTFDGSGALTMHQDHLDRTAERDYVEHYHLLDVGLNTAMNCSSGTWINTNDVIPSSAMQKSQYYTDFMCRHRMRQIVCHIVRIDPVHRACFSFQREKIDETTREHLAGPDISTFAGAMESGLAKRRDLLISKLAATEEALWCYGEAAFLASSSGIVCYASKRASEMFEGTSSIRIRAGRLWHHSARVRAVLLSLITKASLIERVVTVAIPNGVDGTLVLDFKRADAWARLGNETMVMVRIKHSRYSEDKSLEMMNAVFDLTPAESRTLDSLVKGMSANEIAALAGISLHTVRKHISTVMEKTGTKRQSDLVRILLER